MRQFVVLASICLATAGCSRGPQYPYQDSRRGVDQRTEDLLGRMSAAEKREFARNGAANAHWGIPALRLATNPPGSGLALAATWNPELVAKVGAISGSAFGSYSDDPWLASRMAVAWIGAVQSAGHIGEMLDFPCGEGDQREMNEVRYPPFRAAIEEAGLWSVQSSCGYASALDAWGFRGFVPGDREDDEDQARRMLRAMFGVGMFDEPQPPRDPAEAKRVQRLAAEQGVVLLKNDGDLLPLYATKIHSIGVLGSDEQLQAVRERAAATAVIKGDAADIVIEFGAQTITVRDAARQALLAAWPGNPETAHGATDVIFGDANPTGRLPVTLPQYPFGCGLSYTSFEWSELRVFPASPRYGQSVQVVVRVKNAGSRAGAEVVQVYLRESPRAAELKAFARVDLKPGEIRDVAMTLEPRAMTFYDPAVKDWAAAPGVFDVLAGESSRDIRLKGSFELYR
jgi:hypothetical protein